jgi:glycosyltransferase involved in cell wall biosynthesis
MLQDNTNPGSGRVLDISRLLSRLPFPTPTGIDRVELAYARHYLDWPAREDARFLLTTPLNTDLLFPWLAQRVIRRVAERWSPSANSAASNAFTRLCEILRTPLHPQKVHHKINVTKSYSIDNEAAVATATAAYFQTALSGIAGPRLAAIRRKPSWYLHVSHMNLDKPARLAWLTKAGLQSLFFVHDLIPISHPEYCRPGEDVRHRRRIETIAQHASAMAFNSKATQDAWNDYVAAYDLRKPPGEVVPLGIEDVFRNRTPTPSVAADIPYFVVAGTIEARKNLSFLLHVWKQWTRDGQSPRARLVVVGRRGWENENVIDLLDRSTALAPSVVEVALLADTDLAALLRGARALLAPSLIEGFGLPIAEALAAGVPVVASDIAAHREVGGASAEYVDPMDGRGWTAALDDYVEPHSSRRERMQALAKGFQAHSWADHMQAIERILSRHSAPGSG